MMHYETNQNVLNVAALELAKSSIPVTSVLTPGSLYTKDSHRHLLDGNYSGGPMLHKIQSQVGPILDTTKLLEAAWTETNFKHIPDSKKSTFGPNEKKVVGTMKQTSNTVFNGAQYQSGDSKTANTRTSLRRRR
ncbi:hypothetical protein RYX36_022960 [Vicia faba]